MRQTQNLLPFIRGVKVPETGDKKRIFENFIFADRCAIISHTTTTTLICEEQMMFSPLYQAERWTSKDTNTALRRLADPRRQRTEADSHMDSLKGKRLGDFSAEWRGAVPLGSLNNQSLRQIIHKMFPMKQIQTTQKKSPITLGPVQGATWRGIHIFS